MDKPSMEQIRAEHAIRQEFESTLPERVRRHVRVKPHEIVKHTHFTSASTECFGLYRDMYPYGCIALAQAVGEALVRFMCERNNCKASDHFETNVRTLFRRRFISEEVRDWFLKLWQDRNGYHHLNTGVETDRQKLDQTAEQKVKLLQQIEKEVFSFSDTNGVLMFKYPRYWHMEPDGTTEAFCGSSDRH